MALTSIVRGVYALLALLYLALGAGAMLLPTGWLPSRLTERAVPADAATPFVAHLLQEFGTVVLALGLVFLLFASRKSFSRGFHWAITLYFALDALIHWIGPDGWTGSWTRGIVNTIPLAVLLSLGMLELRAGSTRSTA